VTRIRRPVFSRRLAALLASLASLLPVTPAVAADAAGAAAQAGDRVVYGTIVRVDGERLMLETRTKRTVAVDAHAAIADFRATILAPGRKVAVHGTVDKQGTFHAETIQRARDATDQWPEDR
jgi:hypothetical protein